MQNFDVTFYQALLIGIGATAFMDIWSFLQRRLLGIAGLNYALVGRWIAHMAKGQFWHRMIGAAPPCSGEALIGWTAHYAIGVVFAGFLLLAFGEGWSQEPTLGPALLVGILSVAAPFFVMQPAFGLGIAAARTPNPSAARLKSIIAHLSFGLGLYISAVGLNFADRLWGG